MSLDCIYFFLAFVRWYFVIFTSSYSEDLQDINCINRGWMWFLPYLQSQALYEVTTQYTLLVYIIFQVDILLFQSFDTREYISSEPQYGRYSRVYSSASKTFLRPRRSINFDYFLGIQWQIFFFFKKKRHYLDIRYILMISFGRNSFEILSYSWFSMKETEISHFDAILFFFTYQMTNWIVVDSKHFIKYTLQHSDKIQRD